MKKIILVVIFSAFYFGFKIPYGLAQDVRNLGRVEYIALYLKSWKPDSTNYQMISEEPMILLIGDKYSRFSSFNWHLTVDSILPRYPEERHLDMIASRQLPRVVNRYYVFKNRTENILEFYDRLGDLFKYTTELVLFQWKILPNTHEMFGYAVQKATTSFAGRDWVAWFAPEIPISDGPYKFNGLPGLIVLLHDTRNHYRFSLTSFAKHTKEGYIENYNSRYFVVSRKRLIEMRKQFIQDPFSFMPNVTPTGGAAQRKEVLQRLRRRNNPLELMY